THNPAGNAVELECGAVVAGQLPTGPLDDPALLLEMFDHPFTVIALYFNHPVLHRAAGAARCFELFAKLSERKNIKSEPLDQGNAFPLAAFGLSGDAHNAVRHRDSCIPATNTLGKGFSTPRAHFAVLGGVDEPASCFIAFHNIPVPLFLYGLILRQQAGGILATEDGKITPPQYDQYG
ncbi:MAG: hypothetical protein ACYCY5_12840, partial [Sulfuricella sp.]